jgi:hypothetical protein
VADRPVLVFLDVLGRKLMTDLDACTGVAITIGRGAYMHRSGNI